MKGEVKRLIRKLYHFPCCRTGGPLHVITDYHNVEDSDLDFCEEGCKRMEHWSFKDNSPENRELLRELGLEIISKLRLLTESERREVVR